MCISKSPHLKYKSSKLHEKKATDKPPQDQLYFLFVLFKHLKVKCKTRTLCWNVKQVQH